jgi:hypothetical protein
MIRRYAAAMPPAAGIAYRSISPAPLVELAIAYRTDDPSPTLANFVRLVAELAPTDPCEVPDGGELI